MEFLTRFSEGLGLKLLIAGLITGLVSVGIIVRKSRFRPYLGQILVPSSLIALSLLFYAITFSFPKETAGPAVIPHLWIFWTLVLGGAMLWRVFRGVGKPDPKTGRIGFLLLVIILLAGYYFAFEFFGYFLSSFIFLVVLMHLLSYPKKSVIYSVASGWVVFCYIVFYRLLHIQLPLGYFENYF
jgi:hypothetical protein